MWGSVYKGSERLIIYIMVYRGQWCDNIVYEGMYGGMYVLILCMVVYRGQWCDKIVYEWM